MRMYIEDSPENMDLGSLSSLQAYTVSHTQVGSVTASLGISAQLSPILFQTTHHSLTLVSCRL